MLSLQHDDSWRKYWSGRRPFFSPDMWLLFGIQSTAYIAGFGAGVGRWSLFALGALLGVPLYLIARDRLEEYRDMMTPPPYASSDDASIPQV